MCKNCKFISPYVLYTDLSSLYHFDILCTRWASENFQFFTEASILKTYAFNHFFSYLIFPSWRWHRIKQTLKNLKRNPLWFEDSIVLPLKYYDWTKQLLGKQPHCNFTCHEGFIKFIKFSKLLVPKRFNHIQHLLCVIIVIIIVNHFFICKVYRDFQNIGQLIYYFVLLVRDTKVELFDFL